MDIKDMSTEQLHQLRKEIDLKLKKKRTRKPKPEESRKPSLRAKSGKYLEVYQRDMESNMTCKYLGRIGEPDTEEKVKKLGLLEEYKKFLEKIKKG